MRRDTEMKAEGDVKLTGPVKTMMGRSIINFLPGNDPYDIPRTVDLNGSMAINQHRSRIPGLHPVRVMIHGN